VRFWPSLWMAVSQRIGFIMNKMAWALSPSKWLVLRQTCLVALAVAVPAAPAWANTASDSEAETIFVIGQREAPITVVPRGLSISLGKDEFEAVNALNVEDLMKYTPNFFVRKRFAGDDNAVVALRGANTIQSARTIVMVDGFVVSNFLGNRWDFPPKWNVVGPAEVRQFDIVYGPYSARYGGNSMGGVISVTTQEPKESSAYATAQTMIMPFKEYGFDQSFTGHSLEGGVTWAQTDGPWSVRLSGRHFENTGQSMTYNLLTPATGAATAVVGAYDDTRLATPVFGAASPVDVTQDQARLRIGYATAGGWQMDALGMIWLTQQDLTAPKSWLVNANTGAPVTQGRVSYKGRVWNATGLTFSKTRRTEYLAGFKLAGPLADWNVALNLSRYWIPKWDTRTSRDYATGASLGQGTQSLVDSPGWSTGDLTVERDLAGHKLAFGASANLYETATDSFTTTNWDAATAPSFSTSTYGKTRLWGIWAEDTVNLGARWALTGGIRYDGWRAYAGGIAKAYSGVRKDDAYSARSEDSISPKLSLQGDINDALAVQISLGTAKRFPTVGELYQGRFDDIAQAIDPQSFDPNLKAEKSEDANLIVRHRAGSTQTTLSLFYQNIKDAIFSFSGLNQFGTVVTSYKNVDQVRQYGVELIVEAKDVLIQGLDVDANLAWIDAKTIKNASNPAAEGVQFPRIPKWRSNGTLRYRIADPVKLALGWRYASRPNSDLFGLVRGDAFGFQSEYLTVDTRLNWRLTPRLELGAGIDNLFNDKAYVAHPLPQRTYVLDLKATW
jgi:iron complex outermembrane recepter protein